MKLRGLLNKYGDDAMLVTGFLMFVAGILDRRNLILIAGGFAVIFIEIFTVPAMRPKKEEKKHGRGPKEETD